MIINSYCHLIYLYRVVSRICEGDFKLGGELIIIKIYNFNRTLTVIREVILLKY